MKQNKNLLNKYFFKKLCFKHINLDGKEYGTMLDLIAI